VVSLSAELLKYRGRLDSSVIFCAILQGKSANTLKSYKSAFRPWKKFAADNGLMVFPIDRIEFMVFLIHRAEAGASWSTLNLCINSVKFFLQLFRRDNVCNDIVDFQVMHFLKKCSRKPDRKMRPLTKAEFDLIISKHLFVKTLEILRNLCILIFGWIGFLRYDDLAQIKCCNLQIVHDEVRLKLFDAKNDKFKKGQNIRFRLNAVLLGIFKRYILVSGLNGYMKDPNVFLFCNVLNNKCDFVDKLSYSRVRKALLSLCNFAGVNSERIGTHSLRIGGCTEASKRGVPDYILDFHGRWALNSVSRARYQRVVGEDAVLVSEVLNF
jgi:integrase